jgi:hypothetical protein
MPLTACALVLSALSTHADELKAEIDSAAEAFHRPLHLASEMYLVCYYKVDKKPWGKEWEQLEIRATVVDVVNGPKKIGERIQFVRVLDGKYGDISHLLGSLNYVHSHDRGKFEIDAQDPHAIFGYTEERAKVALAHKKAGQAEAGRPANPSGLK